MCTAALPESLSPGLQRGMSQEQNRRKGWGKWDGDKRAGLRYAWTYMFGMFHLRQAVSWSNLVVRVSVDVRLLVRLALAG